MIGKKEVGCNHFFFRSLFAPGWYWYSICSAIRTLSLVDRKQECLFELKLWKDLPFHLLAGKPGLAWLPLVYNKIGLKYRYIRAYFNTALLIWRGG